MEIKRKYFIYAKSTFRMQGKTYDFKKDAENIVSTYNKLSGKIAYDIGVAKFKGLEILSCQPRIVNTELLFPKGSYMRKRVGHAEA